LIANEKRALELDTRNREIFAAFGKPGVVGLAGGSHIIDRTLRKTQRSLRERNQGAPRSLFSHAFICGEVRPDGHLWVLESDLDVRHKLIRLGVQENRAERYFSAADYPNLALLDFNLTAAQSQHVLSTALSLLAGQTTYSLREIVGTLIALQRATWRAKENLFAQNGALFCSAMVQHCYQAIGIDFSPAVSTKNTSPQDIATTLLAHQRFEVIRELN
jgi:hypothetical protein